MNQPKTLYYRAVTKGKPIKITAKEVREVKKEKFARLKKLVVH